jgi:hypothetical protein
MPAKHDGPEPPGQAETQEGRQTAGATSYYRGVALRLCVVVVALAAAWFAPVAWPLKLEIYLAIMLLAVAAVILFRARKRARRTSN